MTPHAAFLLKAPRPGLVKTRLAAEVGPERALSLYRLMAERTAAAVREAGWPGTIWYDPPEAEEEMRRWLGAEWTYEAQPPGDLGTRLARAVAAEPGQCPVLLGGDCPGLSGDLLREAAALLERYRVVVGPAEDGGYYLLGGRVPLPDLFTGMPWSTDRLFQETRRRLELMGVVWAALPRLRDVDTGADARAVGLLT